MEELHWMIELNELWCRACRRNVEFANLFEVGEWERRGDKLTCSGCGKQSVVQFDEGYDEEEDLEYGWYHLALVQ
jgi:hypothetical protein